MIHAKLLYVSFVFSKLFLICLWFYGRYLRYLFVGYKMNNKITVSRLRRLIKEEVDSLFEASDDALSAGKEKAETKGTLDIKKIAETLGVDSGKFSEAVRAAKTGARTPAHNALLGDVFIKLMEASPSDTIKVMNVLKKVEEKK